jgi:tetratricopeptide (TPR) repeat protein
VAWATSAEIRAPPSNTAKRAAFIEKKPPNDAKPAKLARFHARRAKAAMKEGKVAQAIADYATADRLSGKLPAKERAKIKRQRAQAEFVGGNPIDAIARLHEAIEVSPGKVARVNWWILLAKWYEQTGNLAQAETALAQSGRALGLLRSANSRKARKAWFKHGTKIEFLLTHARARLHDASGDYAKAESLYRDALEKYRRGIESQGKAFRVSPRVEELIRADLGRNLTGQHRLIEGEVQIRTALLSALRRAGRYSLVVARLVSELAQVMRAQGRPKDAEALARAALDINE